MKGIYLTEEAKQEIEDIIAELKVKVELYRTMNHSHRKTGTLGQIFILEEMLKSATILPVYKSLAHAMQNKDLNNPKGVIIQPKQ
jgi:hypothetical protein